LKLNGVSTVAICLLLFPFSLKDKARVWLHSLPPDSIRTWDELIRAFLAKFFPPSKTISLRNQITTFTPKVDDHQTFDNRVTQPVQYTIDAAAGSTLMNKTEVEAYNLIEEMALNNFQWSTERGQPLHDLHDKHDKHDVINENEVSIPPNEVIDDVHKSKEPLKNSNVTSPKPYNTPLSFPQGMAKAKFDLQFGKLLEVLKKLYINIPFTDALSQSLLMLSF